VRDISAWLKELGLERYAQAFGDNDIDADVLPSLTDADLRELGVASLGHRKKLLAAIAAPEPPAPAPPATTPVPPAAEGDRRQVTVLFADLSGFSTLAEGRDPEAVHALLNRYFAVVDAQVERFGGHVDKHIGDAVMALFGAPVAHGDDPLRAVRAALGIHAALAALEVADAPALTAHIGIASGQVVASGTGSATHSEYTVIGDSVNLAARLQDLAAAGETLISNDVHQAVAAATEAAACGDTAIKGLERSERVWRVTRVLDAGAVAAATPFVGRSAELTQLDGALTACLTGGRGQAILIRGESGIGKSRLAQELAAHAGRRGFACHAGQVTDFGGGHGSDAVRAVLRGVLGVPGASGDAAAERLDRGQAAGEIPAELRPFLNDLLDLPQPAALRALLDAMEPDARSRGRENALAASVRRAAVDAAQLIAVEDVHCGRASVLAQLAAIAAVTAESRAILVLTCRADRDPLDAAWRGRAGTTPVMTIDLAPLPADDARELAATLAGDDGLIERCLDRAGGNPLFLEQLVRSGSEDAAELPGTLQSVVLAQVDRLDAADKRAVQAAAVLGQRFAPAALVHVAGAPDYETRRLVDTAILRADGNDLHFAHALVRDGVYGSLLRDRRGRLHRRAADWFAGRDDEMHAEHLALAGDPAAAMAFATAARTQADAFRTERALALAERGRALAADDGTRYALEMLLAQLAREAGEPARAIEHCRTALGIAGDDDQRCAACIGVAAGVRLEGGYEDGVAALDAAEPLAAARDDPLSLAQIAYLRGALQFTVGDFDGCFADQQAALEHARAAGAPEWEMRAAGGLADAHYARGHMRSARAAFEHCIAIARAHGFGQIEIDNAFMLGITGRYVGELASSLTALPDAVDLARRTGNRRALLLTLNCLGELLLDTGRYGEAEAPIAETVAIAEALGNQRLLPYMQMNQGRRLWLSRDGASARALLAVARDGAMASEPRYIGPRVLGLTALVAADATARTAALAEGEAILARGCNAHNHLWFRRDAIEASLDAVDGDGALRHAAALEAFARDEPFVWSDYYVAWGRALAAAGQGDGDPTELGRLVTQARDLGYAQPLPRLDAALAQS